MRISNMGLVKIAAVGGVATVTMGLLLRSKINYNVKQMDFYTDALKSLRSHKGAVHLLGEPIKDRAIDVFNENKNFTKNGKAQYEVPVKGTKEKGTLYFWAEQKPADETWIVNQIELELANDVSRRLIIKSINSGKD